MNIRWAGWKFFEGAEVTVWCSFEHDIVVARHTHNSRNGQPEPGINAHIPLKATQEKRASELESLGRIRLCRDISSDCVEVKLIVFCTNGTSLGEQLRVGK